MISIEESRAQEHRITSGSQTSGGVPSCTDLASLPHRVHRLVQAVVARDHLTPSSTKKLLSQSGITPEDLAPWADYDHPDADSYGRKLVYDGGWFELMVMSWVPGDMAAIHDHGYTQWGAVQVFGSAEHAIFKLDNGTLTTAERRVFAAGDVIAVGHDLIHQMGNVGQEPYLTLHLYGCYGRHGDVTADARLYELDEGSVQITSGGVFFALPEADVNRRLDAPRADFPTMLRHKVELMKRLLRLHGSHTAGSFQSDREIRLCDELFAPRTWQAARRELADKRGRSPGRYQRYLDVLAQEIRAAARLQLELVETGLRTAIPDFVRLVEDALATDDPNDLVDEYLDAIEEAFVALV